MADKNLGDLMLHCTNGLEGLKTTIEAMQLAAVGMGTVAAEMNNIQGNLQGSLQLQLNKIKDEILNLYAMANCIGLPSTPSYLLHNTTRVVARTLLHSTPGRNRETNSIIRTANSLSSHRDSLLSPLLGVNGQLVEDFPPTVAHLDALDDDGVEKLYQAFGMNPVVGALEQKKRGLSEFIGIKKA